jgi:molecular chaperone DnaK (HSP70)
MKLVIDIGTSYSRVAAMVDGKLEMIKISMTKY